MSREVIAGCVEVEEVHTVSLPFVPQKGMVLRFNSVDLGGRVKFQVHGVEYDCDAEEFILEGEILKG